MGGGGQWEEGSINGLKNLLPKQGVSPTRNLEETGKTSKGIAPEEQESGWGRWGR